MAITVTGTTLQITGGTSTAPVTMADVAAAVPASVQVSGSYYRLLGITQVMIGDQGATPTYVAMEGIVLDADRPCEIKVDGKRAIPSDTTLRIGALDPATQLGVNGCLLTDAIRINGVAGEVHIYASAVSQYTASFYFSMLYAADSRFRRAGDRIGRCYLWRRNTVQSSDRSGTLTLVPGFNYMYDPNPSGNVRIIGAQDEILLVNTVRADGETIRIDPNATWKWAYNNAKAINFGALPQNTSQLTAYNDSVCESIMEPVWQLVDEKGAPLAVQSASLVDGQGTTYSPAANSDLPNGKLAFTGVVIQRWVDRPGGQAGVTNYTDFSPFTLQVTDANGSHHSIVVDLSRRWQEGEVRRLIVPAVQLAPHVARIVLPETVMVDSEAHDITYIDAPGLAPTIELLHHPQGATSVTVVHSGTMAEVAPGLYHYTLDLPALTLPVVPDYYTVRVQVGSKYDAQTIEIVPPGQHLDVASIAAGVWTHPTRTVTNPELDAPISSRLAAAAYVPPDNAGIAAARAAAEQVRDVELGRWQIVGSQMIFYDRTGAEIARYDLLDENGQQVTDPSQARERRPV